MEVPERTEKALLSQAEQAARRGELLVLQDCLEQAELSFRQALAIYDRLLRETAQAACARAAGEICTSLADICMQQGNMHGADNYYVKALFYDPERQI